MIKAIAVLSGSNWDQGDEIPVSVHRRSEHLTQPKKCAWFNTRKTADADPAPRKRLKKSVVELADVATRIFGCWRS